MPSRTLSAKLGALLSPILDALVRALSHVSADVLTMTGLALTGVASAFFAFAGGPGYVSPALLRLGGVIALDAAHSLRLLAAHGFHFKDLGLAREEADKAPAALRARFLEIGEDVARVQPMGQGLVVSTLVKMVADQVGYVPPRFTIWAMYGRDPEVGISKGFQAGRLLVAPVRFRIE